MFFLVFERTEINHMKIWHYIYLGIQIKPLSSLCPDIIYRLIKVQAQSAALYRSYRDFERFSLNLLRMMEKLLLGISCNH